MTIVEGIFNTLLRAIIGLLILLITKTWVSGINLTGRDLAEFRGLEKAKRFGVQARFLVYS